MPAGGGRDPSRCGPGVESGGPEVPERVRKLSAQIKALEKALQEARRRSSRDLVGEILSGAKEVAGVRRVFRRGGGDGRRCAAGSGRRGEGEALERDPAPGSPEGERCHLVAGVTSDLTGRFSASDIVRKAAALVGGGGGGRKDMAQAGGSASGICRKRSPRSLPGNERDAAVGAAPRVHRCYPAGFPG